MFYRNRRHAGMVLAGALDSYSNRADVIVLGLPRGGVPVAYEVAQELDAPLDVFLVRKLGVPDHPELAMGAVSTGGVRVLNEEVIDLLHIPLPVIERVAAKEERELARQEKTYRGAQPPIVVAGKTVILVDDGLATGSTMRAAALALFQRGAKRIVIGVPVAPPEACREMRRVADEVVCAYKPDPFMAVGVWYQDFAQTTDQEVRALLEDARRREGIGANSGRR